MVDVDYVSNADPATFPDGLDTEVFSFNALEEAWRDATEPADREHVTPYLRRSERFRRANVTNDVDLSEQRWTLDEPEDLVVLTAVFDHFGNDEFTFADVAALQEREPELFDANRNVPRNEGTGLGSGQKLWKRAKQVIPGGSMLLSKRPEMLLPEHWPTYFSRAKGCRVWDLDDRELVDVSLMGVGTNILGYGHPGVDEAVARVVRDGNLSTLNAPEEVAPGRGARRPPSVGRHGPLHALRRRGLRGRRPDRPRRGGATGGRVLRLPRLARLVPRRQPRA